MSITFFFSHLEDSTGLLGRLGDDYTQLLGDARGLLRRAVVREAGREVDHRADEHFCVFDRAERGCRARRPAGLCGACLAG